MKVRKLRQREVRELGDGRLEGRGKKKCGRNLREIGGQAKTQNEVRMAYCIVKKNGPRIPGKVKLCYLT